MTTYSHETAENAANLAERPAFPVTQYLTWRAGAEDSWYRLPEVAGIRVDVYRRATYSDGRPWMVIVETTDESQPPLYRGSLDAALTTGENRLREVLMVQMMAGK